MAVNLSTISGAAGALPSFGNLIFVTPKNRGITTQSQATYLKPGEGIANYKVPKPNGIPILAQNEETILFQYEGENTALLESEITDYFSEANSVLNDNISLKPEVITVHGFVGELNDLAPQFPETIKFAYQKLYALSVFAPALSITAMNALNTLIATYQAANSVYGSVESALKFFGLAGSTTVNGVAAEIQTKQQYFFFQFYYYWINRQMFKVQTPWATFDNMVIKSLRAIQSEETRMITDFEVTFKRYYVTSGFAALQKNQNPQNAQDRRAASASEQSNGSLVQLAVSSKTFIPGGIA